MGNFISLSSRRYSVWPVIVFCLLMLPLPALNGAQFFNDWAATNLVSVPSQSGPLDDPDNDGVANLAEFAFGTDPLAGDGFGNSFLPVPTGTDGVFQVSLFEQGGHKPGVQIDVDATADLVHWIRPWWLRTTNSLPGDPTNSVRETLTTYLPGTNLFIIRGAVHLIEAGPEAANYYVATNGSDGASGASIDTPYRSLAKAVGAATTGNLIYVRGGTYSMSNKIVFTHSGSPAQPIRLRAYPGELPILDCTLTASNTDCLVISGNCWQVYGLMITNSGHNSIRIMRDSNIVERCISYGARNTGFHISGGDVPSTIFPASNLFLNCDSIRSYDAPKYGSDADGFSAKWNLGPDNVFRGCRSWENSDDGWDLWMGTSPVLIDTCWAFRNGVDSWGAGTNFAGNGNGFKLGGSYVPAAHRLLHSVAYSNVGTNGGKGIDQNNNTAGLTVDNNTSWGNRSAAINLNTTPTTTGVHVVRNNLVISGTVYIQSSAAQISNSWQVISSPAANSNDVLSMDTSFFTAPRRDDGSLPENPLVRPVPGGRLVDRGTTNVGIAFYGSAPDLGAFESPTWDGLH